MSIELSRGSQFQNVPHENRAQILPVTVARIVKRSYRLRARLPCLNLRKRNRSGALRITASPFSGQARAKKRAFTGTQRIKRTTHRAARHLTLTQGCKQHSMTLRAPKSRGNFPTHKTCIFSLVSAKARSAGVSTRPFHLPERAISPFEMDKVNCALAGRGAVLWATSYSGEAMKPFQTTKGNNGYDRQTWKKVGTRP